MAETLYTPRLTRPGIAIERGRNQVVTCPVYDGSTLTAPSTGTFKLYNPAGATVHSSTVSVASDTAEATVLSSEVVASNYGTGWSSEWVLTMPDGAPHTFREVAALCRVGSQRRVTPADLYRLEPYLNPAVRGAVWTETGEEQCIEAWLEIEHVMWGRGQRPWLVVNQASLRQVELHIALRMCYEALVSANRAAWSEKVARAVTNIDRAWSSTTLDYDLTGSGIVGASGVSARPSGWWAGGSAGRDDSYDYPNRFGWNP